MPDRLHLFQRVEPFIESNEHLLDPQRHGWLNIKHYFESDPESYRTPALAVIPTGCGKTGLIAILPFGIANGRVLVITPGLVVNEGVLENLDSSSPDNFWLRRNVLFRASDLPHVVNYRSDLHDDPLNQADIVIGNIQQMLVQNRNSLVNRVDPGFFDMIIVDEGHHAPADSWQEVFQRFPTAKKVLVTGTPFRGDGASIHGKLVYEYTLGRAMHQRLVKRVIQQQYISEELLFTVDGYEAPLSLAEVLCIKDQEWVRRSVAYSTECTRQVVLESLRLLNEKRRTGTKHKILASACSIAHAKQIKEIYKEEGAEATIIHSDMDEEEKASNIRDFERDRCQVMVHVNMLGEGYDHPEISIVAMFKPYRSLNQYAQLAGRALRVIRDTQYDDIDNVAHLVYHKELGLEGLWEYYRKEKRRAEIYEALDESLLTGLDDEDGESSSRARPPLDIGDVMEVGSGYINRESFLDDYDIISSYERAKAAFEERITGALNALIKQGVPVTPEIEEVIVASLRAETLRSKRPDLELSEMRRAFASRIQDSVSELLLDCGIDPKGTADFMRLRANSKYRWITDNPNNEAFLIQVINYELKQFIGRSRDKWSRQDYLEAETRLGSLLEFIKFYAEGGSRSDGTDASAD